MGARSQHGGSAEKGPTNQPGRYLRIVRSQGHSLIYAVPAELARQLGLESGVPLVVEAAGPYLVARRLDLLNPAQVEEIEAAFPPPVPSHAAKPGTAGLNVAWRQFIKSRQANTKEGG